MHRDTLMAAAAAYKGMTSTRKDTPGSHLPTALHGTEDGNIPATFQVIFMVSGLLM
jgi:hypothetical protein